MTYAFALFILTLATTAYAPRSMGLQATGNAVQADQSSVLNELPLGSDLRQRLVAGQHGDRIESPYMKEMRNARVKRALFEVAGVWTHDGLKSLSVVRRLYFDKYDGPYAQVTDPARSAEIKSSGLENLLDQVALQRAKATGLFTLHGLKGSPPWKVYGFQEFFDNGTLPEMWTPLSQFIGAQQRHPFTDLIMASSMGDMQSVKHLLDQNTYSHKELNGALFEAVGCGYDNSAIIEALLHAGADVNARGYEDRTPLMMAIDKPLNLEAVLRAGANLNQRDRYGNTAFKLAKQNSRLRAIEILRASGADVD